jgi:chromosome segregation ATPase
VDSPLEVADELERRDADVATRLARVEQRQRDVDDLREATDLLTAQLQRLPEQLERQADDEAAALEAQAQAVTAVREREEALARSRDADRPTAERHLDDARASLHAAERVVVEAKARGEALRAEEAAAGRDVASAVDRAHALGAPPTAHGEPADVLAALAAWASKERGALLVEHSGLERERDAVVREASELLGSVLGEPMASTAVAGLRARIERSAASSA